MTAEARSPDTLYRGLGARLPQCRRERFAVADAVLALDVRDQEVGGVGRVGVLATGPPARNAPATRVRTIGLIPGGASAGLGGLPVADCLRLSRLPLASVRAQGA